MDCFYPFFLCVALRDNHADGLSPTGPGCGAIGAVGFYNFIKMLEYEMANPGQDSTSEGKAAREASALKEKKDEETAALA